MYQSGPGSSCALHLLTLRVIEQTVYETKIHDSNDLRKCLMQTSFDFDQNIIDNGVTVWDHVCMLMVDTLNTRCDMTVHLYDSPEDFMKLSMQFHARNGYFVVNIKRWSCVHMHFRFFDFHKVVQQH